MVIKIDLNLVKVYKKLYFIVYFKMSKVSYEDI